MNIFKVLSEQEVKKLHSTSLEILNTIGLKIHSEKARKVLEEAGATVDHKTRLVRFPPHLVDESIKRAPRRVIYGARNPKYDLVLEPGGNTYSRPITGAEGYIDLETGKYRLAKMSDVKDWVRLVDALDNISYCTLPYPSDVDPDTRDFRLMPVALENTEKHIELQPYGGEAMEVMVELALAVMGSQEELKRRPILTVLTSILSPLQLPEYATDVLFAAGKHGIPVEINSMAIAGGTAPVTVAGVTLVSHTEVLAGIVVAEILNPGAPVVYRPLPMVMDMASGLALEGTVENAMMAAAQVQLIRETCGIPTNMFGQIGDGLITDGQSMIERVFNTLLPALAGANIVSGAGSLEHVYTIDPVQLVIDDEILGMTYRMLRGFEISDDTLGLDALARVGPGGNFLTDKHTLKYFKTEYFRPHIFNWKTREKWQSEGEKDLNENARQRAKTILREHKPSPLAEDIVKELDSIIKRIEKTYVLKK